MIIKKHTVKKDYLPPAISTEEVEMENGIAAGSATVITVNPDNQVQEDFGNGNNESNDFQW